LSSARRLCKRLSEPPSRNGLIRKAACGRKENTAAEFSGCSIPHACVEPPLPPPDTTIHRIPPHVSDGRMGKNGAFCMSGLTNIRDHSSHIGSWQSRSSELRSPDSGK